MGLLERTEERGREKKQQKRGRETNTSSMSNSHNFLSSMDRLSASLSTPLGSRTAMEQEFDRKFMAGIKTRGAESKTTFSSSAGSSLAHQSQSTLSNGFSPPQPTTEQATMGRPTTHSNHQGELCIKIPATLLGVHLLIHLPTLLVANLTRPTALHTEFNLKRDFVFYLIESKTWALEIP